MVVWSKILPLLAAGVGIMVLVNAFTRPAHAQQTAGALTSTFGSFGAAGQGIADFGQGIGHGLAGLFKPVWEVANLFERFSSLSIGSANVGGVQQQENQQVQSGSGGSGTTVAAVPGVVNYNPNVSVTGGSEGVEGTIY